MSEINLLSKELQAGKCSAKYEEKFYSLLDNYHPGGISKFLEAGLALHKDKKVLDFVVRPGHISTRIQIRHQGSHSLDIRVQELSSEKWAEVFLVLSSKAIYSAKLLSQEMPTQIEEAFAQAGCQLIPTDDDGLRIRTDCPETELGLAIAAFYWKLCERLEQDPFVLFSLRGMGREETLARLRQCRIARKEKFQEHPLDLSTHFSSLQARSDSFWDTQRDLSSASYSIRADELPAALLRRLDSLPLYDLEDDAESLLDEAYVQVATRAQGFALGLLKM